MKLPETFVDLDAARERPPRNRINRIGIELEGGWTTLPKGISLQADSSVRFGRPNRQRDELRITQEAITAYRRLPGGRTPQGEQEHAMGALAAARARWQLEDMKREKDEVPPHIGELPSPGSGLAMKNMDREDPLQVQFWKDWIKKHYPSHVNDTCGMHVHMSFLTDLTYARLADPRYPSTVVEYFRRWGKLKGVGEDHPLWPRLRGESEYCQHKFFAEKQIKHERKDYEHHSEGCRYTVINYPHRRTKTIECRLLPMFAVVDLAIDAIEELILVTNSFLLATARREPQHEITIPVDDTVLREQVIVQL